MRENVPFRDQPVIVRVLIVLTIAVIAIVMLAALVVAAGFAWRAAQWAFS